MRAAPFWICVHVRPYVNSDGEREARIVWQSPRPVSWREAERQGVERLSKRMPDDEIHVLEVGAGPRTGTRRTTIEDRRDSDSLPMFKRPA